MSLFQQTEQRLGARTTARPLVGPILVGINVVHLGFTSVFQPAFLDLLASKLAGRDAAVSLAERATQESGFWYVITGVAGLMLGGLAWWAERQGAVLPTALGVALLALTLSGLLLGPVTGFWLFLVPGVLVLLRRRRGSGQRPSTEN